MNGYKQNNMEKTGEKDPGKNQDPKSPDQASENLPEDSEERKKERKDRPPLEAKTFEDRIALCHACAEKMAGDIPVLRDVYRMLTTGVFIAEKEGTSEYIEAKKKFYKENYSLSEMVVYLLKNYPGNTGGGNEGSGEQKGIGKPATIEKLEHLREVDVQDTESKIREVRQKLGLSEEASSIEAERKK